MVVHFYTKNGLTHNLQVHLLHMTINDQIQLKLIELGGDIILIHSDIRQGFEIPFINKTTFLNAHIEKIKLLRTNMSIWMPSFNYDFVQKGKSYQVNNCPSQVGVLSEYFRRNDAEWRTPIPVFSFAGMGEQPILDISGMINPFGWNSAWMFLYEKNALLMFYGASFNSSTILHYIETVSNCLCYRYDKLFYGKIEKSNGEEIDATLVYHVRPMGRRLVYDVNRTEDDLKKNDILFLFQESRSVILLCRVRDLVNFCLGKLKQDPLYFLDIETKLWVEPLLNRLGRPFIITDFEKSQD